MLPSFIIIGAMKGGTTALYHYLASHPDIEPSSLKETNFFTKQYGRGLDWYSSLFQVERKYAMEASPSYTKRHRYTGVPERIHAALPEVKLLYLLRDPIDRLVSQYSHNFAQGRESRSLSEVIRSREKKYYDISKYYYQIEPYLEVFDPKQLLLIESERLRKHPEDVLVEISNFLGISPDFDAQTTAKRFHESSEKTRATWLERTLKKKIKNRDVRRQLKGVLRPFRRPFSVPELSDPDREVLQEEFAPDVKKLREYSGMEFSSWSM